MKLIIVLVCLSFCLKIIFASSGETCNFTSSVFRPSLINDIKDLVKQEVQRQRYIGESSQYAAYSCDEIKQIKPCQDPGEYWILNNGIAQRQYCLNSASWTSIAKVDMKHDTNCAGGLLMIHSGSKRFCQSPLSLAGCYSITFPVNGKKYKWVRGRIIGYQFESTNAFGDQESGELNAAVRTIDDQYVDGVSITHGRPRSHIWTFAVGYNLGEREKWHCPCTNSSYRKSLFIPAFVGESFYCDIGTHQRSGPSGLVLSNALWDGENCAPSTFCCTNPNLPWFERELPSITTDDIELRICRDQERDNEDIYLENIELYIR